MKKTKREKVKRLGVLRGELAIIEYRAQQIATTAEALGKAARDLKNDLTALRGSLK